MSGAAAARYVLDSAGLQDVAIEPVQGFLSDHYDPRHKVLRLSPHVYQGRSRWRPSASPRTKPAMRCKMPSGYAPLVIRNAAVPVASFGGGISMVLLMIGFMMSASAARQTRHHRFTAAWCSFSW